jgi:GH24 family phage-related lysozyme (muramidase)
MADDSTLVRDNGLNYIANLEVLKNDLVLDSNGNILEVKQTMNNTTIGYGYDLTQDPLKLGIKTATNISNGTALDYLKKASEDSANKISTSSDISITLNQCQLDALVALRYNVGSLGAISNIFNDINNKASYNTFQNDIFKHYEHIVENNPDKAQYLDGWKNRAVSILDIYFNGDYGSMPINAVKGVYN